MEYIGADVDINNVVCSIMSASGKKKETFVVPSNPKGMDQLIEKMGKSEEMEDPLRVGNIFHRPTHSSCQERCSVGHSKCIQPETYQRQQEEDRQERFHRSCEVPASLGPRRT